jgi:hypothetical protein
MIKKQDCKQKWSLMIIDDPALLTGQTIFSILNLLAGHAHFKYVIINDVEGAAQKGLIPSLRNLSNQALMLNDFLQVVCEVQQFDWADFFLFRDFPLKWENNGNYLYPELIGQSDTTVRAVDDQYLYVYTPLQTIVDSVRAKYQVESVTVDLLENLEFPY